MERPIGIDWQKSVNSPVYTIDGKELGFITSIQPDKFIVASSPISPGKFLIPKSSVRGYEAGTIYLDEDLTSVTNNYQFE
jgi:hypothetical protein